MEKITVTQAGAPDPYMSYLFGKITDKFSFLPCAPVLKNQDGRTTLVFAAEGKYCPYIRKYAEENIAEVIAVGYKYRYFKEILSLPCLSGKERDILLVSLVSADLAEDREYVKKRFTGAEKYCIDGTYNFRLNDLKRRWRKIAEYIPAEFNGAALESFVEFLVGEGAGKTFLKDGVLYDEDYRPLRRSRLIGEESPVSEILLSGAESVYCFGSPDRESAEFLKKYYKEKAVFC